MQEFGLKKRIILPLVAIGLVVLLIGLYFIAQLEHREIHDAVQKQASSLQNHLRTQLNVKAEVMAAILGFMARDSQIIAALKAKDRDALLKLSSALFKRLLQEHSITHFYFHDKQRVNLLRVHAPERHGDVINRFTLTAAEKNTVLSSGIELGPLGTFTLRCVLPVFENNQLLGYIELGQEIDALIQQTHTMYDVELYMFIDKQYLDRGDWEAGMKMLRRAFDWDQFPAAVLTARSMADVPVDFLAGAARRQVNSALPIEGNILLNKRRYWAAGIPMPDAGGRQVATMFVLYDMTPLLEQSGKDTLIFVGFSSAIALGVLVFFYVILGRTEKELITTKQNFITIAKAKEAMQAGFIHQLQHEHEMLRESEEQTRLLLNAVGEGIYGLDLQGKTTFVNPAACQMLGYQADELLDRSMHALVHHSHPDGTAYLPEECPIHAALLNGKLNRVSDEAFWRKGGSSFPVEYTTTPVLKAGKPAGAVVIFSDNTERKRAQKKIEQALHVQRVLDTILNISLPPLSLQEILSRSLDAALSIPTFSLLHKGAVFLTGEDGHTLTMAAQRNLSDALLQSCSKILFGQCLCGKAAASREIVFAAHLDSSHEIRYDGIKPHGHFCIPMLSEGHLHGVLNMYVPDGHDFDEEEQNFLKTVADTMAVVIERKKAEETLRQLAHHDILTGLPNRALFYDRLQQIIALAHRHQEEFAVMYLDLDYFKDINDTLGHDAGDAVLKEVANRLQDCIERKTDTVSRMGGDEFTVILTDVAMPEKAGLVAQRIIDVLSQPFELDGKAHRIGCSIGIAHYPTHGDDDETLVKHADEAMYQAKKQRNTYCFFQRRA